MNYIWEVTGLKTTEGGGVVQTYWTKTGTDSDGCTGAFAGATPFEVSPDDADYIAFESLTEADVLQWIKAVVVDGYEEHVNGQIQKQIDQQTINNAPMPWADAELPQE